MNRYSKRFLTVCSTLGLSLLPTYNVQASTFAATTVEPFLEINLENTKILEDEENITLNTDGNITIVTDPSITFEPVEFEPTIGIDLFSILNEKNFIADVTGDLTIFGLINIPENQGEIELIANSITINSGLGNIDINTNAMTINPGNPITVNPGDTITINPGDTITINPGNPITVNPGSEGGGTISIVTGPITISNPVITRSVPESTSIFSLLTIGAMGSFLSIKSKFKLSA